MGVAAVLALVLGASAAYGQPAARPPAPSGDGAAFAAAVQRAARAGDRQALVGMMRFPIGVETSGFTIPFNSAADLLKQFDAILPPSTLSTIASAEVRPNGDSLFFGNALLEASRVGDRFLITAMRLPVPAKSGGAAAPESSGPVALSIRVGGRPTQRAGNLPPGGKDVYIVRAGEQQLLEVRIDGVRGRDIVARVLQASTGAAVDPRAEKGMRAWSARVAAGDYRIEIVREGGQAPSLTYTASFSLR